MKRKIGIAFCMNIHTDAHRLSTQMQDLGYEVEAHVCDSFNDLMACISTHHVDTFVFDSHSLKFNVKEVVQKLKRTRKFGKSTFVMVNSPESDSFDTQMKGDIVIVKPFVRDQYSGLLVESWEKQLNKVLPEAMSVLILDNNPNILEILGMHMEQLEHKNFVCCQSVKEAKKMIEVQDFDLLLLDWDLDDGTCFEVMDHARKVERSQRLKEAITIVITGRNDVEDIMTLVQKNISDHIIKPFDYSEFEDKIFYAVKKHHRVKPTL